MHVKADTLGYNDFVCLSLNGIDAKDSTQLFERMDEMLETGASYPLDEDFGRDGCYEDREIYLIYECADLERVIDYCQNAARIKLPPGVGVFCSRTRPARFIGSND